MNTAPDGTPLWLKIVLGVIPLIASMLAGAFLLTNTMARRIERLKNLVGILKDIPDWLNPNQSVERMIATDLLKIVRLRSPKIKRLKRISVAIYLAFFIFYMSTYVSAVTDAPISTTLILGAIGVFFLASYMFAASRWMKAQHELRARYSSITDEFSRLTERQLADEVIDLVNGANAADDDTTSSQSDRSGTSRDT
ncbi:MULTISPECIES: hypothetical protein [Mycobacteroides]|uniref:hypothetical protein n=1 Tax=Mycobacteroides TaxID=670516 RepID=UPI0004AA3843|nr:MULTISPECIES: hypothetical protein [Mycobacteroides]MBF9315247.1 hypothetical protein [Mycobacteroides chelonae]MBN7298210.1 hypothetical protein [Mycobacteroides abscessus subsp. abscessus]OHT73832.1 hypothetical protein BKG66_06225 [Mycobacteroides chelonae]OHT91682.1 hypothetical protein BKG70_03245 [Mycobacteroides chelonae]